MTWVYWCAGVAGADAMAGFMRAMLSGMAILVVPSFAVCSGIAWMAYRRRHSFAGGA